MKVKLSKNILLDEVNKANKIVDPKAVNPELLGICFDLQPEGLTILSTNGTMNWKSIINKEVDPNIDIEEIGKTLLKGRYLIDVLRKIDDDVIELEIVETSELIIRGEKVKFTLQLLDSTDFPMIGFRENGTELDFNPQDLKKAISQTAVSINELNKKLVFTGLNLKVMANSDELNMYATDSFRVSKKTLGLNNKVTDDVDIVIPFKTVNEITRLLDTAKEAKIILFEGYILLKIDNHSLFQSTLIDGHFPNVDKAFPTEFNTVVTIKKSDFSKSLSRANLTSEEGLSPTLVLDINEQEIKYTSSNPDVGNYSEIFQGYEFKGEPIKISFNIKFLLEALRTFDGDQVELKFISATKPLEIVDHMDESLEQLILPLIIG